MPCTVQVAWRSDKYYNTTSDELLLQQWAVLLCRECVVWYTAMHKATNNYDEVKLHVEAVSPMYTDIA